MDGTVDHLERLLRDVATSRGVRHAVMAVERGDGSFRWSGAAGLAHPGGAAMRPDTPYYIASVTKLFIAVAAMQLHERGRLQLDAPVATYLPPRFVDGLHRLGGVDRSGEITVRHLLGHTSGLADCFEDRPKGGRSLVEEIVAGGDRAWTLEDLLRVVRERLQPHFPPQPANARRQKVRYSDTNFQLLVAVVEAVAGLPFATVLRRNVLEPLQLRCTYVPGHPWRPEPALPPATLWMGGTPADLPRAMRSFGDLVSTTADQLRFMRALARGELFEDATTFLRMQERWNRFGLPLDPAALRLPGWPIEYGLGVMRFGLPRLLTPTAAMAPVIGHTGSTGSWLFHCPARDLFVAGTVDQAMQPALPFRIIPRLLRAVRG